MRQAFTLIELVMVLVILTALAATVVSLVDRGIEIEGKSIEQVATEKTMREIRDAVMGTGAKQGMWADLGQRRDLFPNDPNVLLSDVTPAALPSEFANFDPISKTGWRGPYLRGPSSVLDAWRNPIRIRLDFNDDGTITDSEAKLVVLISYGENGEHEFLHVPTLPNGTMKSITFSEDPMFDEATIMAEHRGDDVVQFFRVADSR